MYTYRLTGNTYESKDLIKSMYFRWHSPKKTWWRKSREPLNLKDWKILKLLENGVTIQEIEPNGVSTYHNAPVNPRNDLTFKSGDQVEIKAWIAKAIAKQQGLELCFRNIMFTEVYAESAKAVQAKFKFVSKVANSCHLCGRELDNDISRATGIGPVCAKKLKLDRGTYEDAELCLKFLDEYAEKIGEVGPVWLPKSQMI